MTDEQPQPDFGAFMAQAAAMQEQLVAAREEIAQQSVEGVAGNGQVRVEVTGGMEFKRVHIDPAAMSDAEMLEDLLLIALRDAIAKVDELNQQAVGDLFG